MDERLRDGRLPAARVTPAAGRVCMFVLNPLTHDTRVERQAATLAAAGYEVRIVAAARQGLVTTERRAGATVVRVDEDPLPTKLVRALIGWRRGGPAAAPGSVITRERAEAAGVGARLARLVLAIHLSLVWRKYRRTAYRAARDERADIWIAHDLDTLPVALRSRRRLGGRVLYDSHELFIDSSLARGRRRAWARLEGRLIGRADAAATVSPSIADVLASRYRIQRPHVILNVPEASVPDLAEPVDLAAEASLPADTRIAIYVGGIQQDRGLEELIEAAGRREDVAVVMLGPGTATYRAHLTSLANAIGVSDRVRLLEPVAPPAIARWAGGADIGVSPVQRTYLSYYYSLPNKLFDYLRAGLPVVVSDFPDMRALVQGHDVGVTCDPSSPSDIAAAIGSVIADASRYEEMRANARRVSEQYTWEREGAKLLRIVSELS
jgi:glycosyltransferase involved in cell wall biosynthesis